jgi:O-antigen/teichoic acid export membrane protein
MNSMMRGMAGKILYRSMYWKVFQLILSFFINIFLARLFQSSISAEFYSFVYLLSLCASFFTLGLDIGLNYYLSRREISPRAACGIIAVVTLLTLAITIPCLALVYRPATHPDIPAGAWWLLAAFHLAGVILTNLSGTLFTAYGRNDLSARYVFFINLALAAALVLISLYFNGRRLVEGLFFVYFFFSFLQGMVLYILAVTRYASRRESEGAQQVGMGRILRYSFTAFVTNFIFFLGLRLNIYLLPFWVNPADQGNYIQAYKLVEYLALIASFLYYPFIALVAGPYDDRTKQRLLLFLVRMSNTAVALFSILMLVAGKTLLPLIYGHSFDRMYGIFVCLIPGLFAVCSSTFLTAWFYGAGRLKYNLISGCIQLGTAAGAFFLLVRVWDVRGAALAFSLASLASMGYDCFVFRKETPYGFRHLLLPQRSDWRMIRLFTLQLMRPAGK